MAFNVQQRNGKLFVVPGQATPQQQQQVIGSTRRQAAGLSLKEDLDKVDPFLVLGMTGGVGSKVGKIARTFARDKLGRFASKGSKIAKLEQEGRKALNELNKGLLDRPSIDDIIDRVLSGQFD